LRYYINRTTIVGDPPNHPYSTSLNFDGPRFRGGLVSKSLCGIPYKKLFKSPQRPLIGKFCMGDYKSLAAIAALPQWPVRPCPDSITLTPNYTKTKSPAAIIHFYCWMIT
jgi:hypothetical protein